ncbi:MAG: YeeE/YedE family protein [Ferrovum sp.]|nr:YeeE/YedE family protein [Ferrovum sp.]
MEVVFLGFLFGAALAYARLNCFDTIVGMALLKNFTMAKTMAFALGLGVVLMQAEIHLGWASYHIKPLIVLGLIGGGVLFGMGMAILGYCPGTIVISLGQGNLDALVGIIGGLFGSLLFAVLYPGLAPLLGPDLGTPSVSSTLHDAALFWPLTLLIGVIFMGLALVLQRMEGGGWRWLHAAVGLTFLNLLLNLPAVAGHPMGASTAFPFAVMALTHLGAESYWHKIAEPGAWELRFLIGAFLAGLVFSLYQRQFRIVVVPSLWVRYHGTSVSKRGIWSFVGGVLILFGARMAGGCTSGHIISGGMQLAFSSMLFAAVVFPVFLLTGRLFYQMREKPRRSGRG